MKVKNQQNESDLQFFCCDVERDFGMEITCEVSYSVHFVSFSGRLNIREVLGERDYIGKLEYAGQLSSIYVILRQN